MAKQTFIGGQVLTAAQVTALQANDYNQTVSTKTTSYVLVAADVGTRVYMNAAGATTITVNTGLFAAGDTLWLGNIGAGACVVTAGTATVDKFSTASLTISQYQSAVLYFTSTGVSILYSDSAGASTPLTTKGDLFTYSTLNARLAVGTNNQVLTADSAEATGIKWATAGATAKSYSLLGTGTLTGASTVTVSGISGINTLYVIINNGSSTAGDDITLRINADSGSNYSRFGIDNSNAIAYTQTNYSTVAQVSSSQFFLANMPSGGTGTATVAGGVVIDGCNSSGVKMIQAAVGNKLGDSTGNVRQTWQSGYYTGTSTVSSVSLLATNNFDAGAYYVYGSA